MSIESFKVYIHFISGGSVVKTNSEESDIEMSVQDIPPQKKKIKLEVFNNDVLSPGNKSEVSS